MITIVIIMSNENLRSQDETVDNQILEGRLVEEKSGQDKERVEPSSGLINTLRDKIGWESVLKLIL